MGSIDQVLAATAAAQERHFIKRVRERFGLKLSPARYRLWIAKVEEVRPGVKWLGSCDEPGRTFWLLRVGGLRLRVIYDEATARLVTALPYGRESTATLHRKKLLRLRRRDLARHAVDHLAKQRRLNS